MDQASHAPGMAFVFSEHIFDGRGVGIWRGGKERALTFFIALTALTANAFSLFVLHHLPSSAGKRSNVAVIMLTLYLCLANILMLLGIVGAVRQHARFINMFSCFLTVDTLVSMLGRILVLSMIFDPTSHLCTAPLAPSRKMTPISTQSGGGFGFAGEDGKSRAGAYAEWWARAGRWERLERCERATLMARVLLCVVVLVAAGLQILAVAHVRRYGSELISRQRRAKQAAEWMEGGESSLRMREARRERLEFSKARKMQI